ncbi:unnamed protein product [Adineta steineri]|uniref:Uncharacterized protein n=1 Tax=Adineta steineri TaxID=433720 RepID=A0A818K8J9_9BILA|nr:unnamed protein product [Adineta steineri]
MTFTSNETSETKNDEVNSSSSSDCTHSMEHEEIEHINKSSSTKANEEQQFSSSNEYDDELTSLKEKPVSIVFNKINNENLDNKRRNLLKSRSVSFAPTVEEYEIPARSSVSSDCSSDYIDALVDSYKLQTSINLFPLYEEKKYVPKTTRSRLNPNWREHRIRHLMNKLEELSLWDREEELKVSQAQFLREQKLEQIQDRQRNNNLCLRLMRQRHESEMESAVLLDQGANNINNEHINATIAQTMKLTSKSDVFNNDLSIPSYNLKRRFHQDQEKLSNLKTPIGRYRQFETNMNDKLEKINEKIQPDREIMRAYNPYYTSIPKTVVPLFSETYASLLSIPDIYSSNRYNQRHYSSSPNLCQSPQHASSPDYETRARSYSNRDVRVPLKEESGESDDDNNNNNNNHDNSDDDDYHNYSRINYDAPKRSTSLISTTASSLYDCSLIHSRQPISNNIRQRSLNDDLNTLTYYSDEINKKKLQNIPEISTKKRVAFNKHDDDEDNFNYNKSSKTMYQPAIISLSSL